MFNCKRPTIIFCLASLLTACANNPNAKNLEQLLAADPRLQTNSPVLGVNATTPQPTATPTTSVQLPSDFPVDLPVYPGTTLQEVSSAENNSSTKIIRWQSIDPSNAIFSFYQTELKAKNWQIIQSPSDDSSGFFIVERNNQQAKISIQPKTVTNPSPNLSQTATELTIEYAATGIPIANATPSPLTPFTANNPTAPTQTEQSQPGQPQPGDRDFIGPTNPQTIPNPNPPITNNIPVNNPPQQYTDLASIPQPTQGYIQDLATLGVIPLRDQNKTSQSNLFQPNKIITRATYAHWLVAANNSLHANKPDKQIRLADTSKQPTFKDVPPSHPDFPFIQGLAEAGLIPSPLSGDATEVLFRPDAPLVREALIQWKIPLDIRQALPNANLNAVQQTWGFQDVAKIDPKALRAVLADYQNADKSNIRRVFGYTTIFQPKKPVTLAETAAALWYFGTQGEGISAREALKLKQ